METEKEYLVPPASAKKRLDLFLSELTDLDLSRSQIKKLIENGNVSLNNQPAKPSQKIKARDRLRLIIPPPKELTIKAENIPLEIVYEDNDLIVVNKPKGMVTHPAPGHYSGTLVNALLHHCKLAQPGAPLRPGIVQRLDKDTSGLIVVAKANRAYHSLVKQLKNRTVEKTYVALVHGQIKNNEGMIEARIGRQPVNRKKMAVLETKGEGQKTKGREAITYYKVLERFKKYSLVEVKIKTGRTHQIRLHLTHIGQPLVGDPTYGGKKNEFKITGQLLHAKELVFIQPTTGEKLKFEAEMPAEMSRVLRSLR